MPSPKTRALPPGTTLHRDLFFQDLGYEPRVSIQDGLQRLEVWFRETGG